MRIVQPGVLWTDVPATHMHCELRQYISSQLCVRQHMQPMQRWALRSELPAMYVTDVSVGVGLLIFQTSVLRTATAHLTQANCESNTTCNECNSEFLGTTCSHVCDRCECINGPHYCSDSCIANCDSTSQANCVSDSICSQCNAGYFGTTCQPCRAAMTW
jgi:hypothetical protein